MSNYATGRVLWCVHNDNAQWLTSQAPLKKLCKKASIPVSEFPALEGPNRDQLGEQGGSKRANLRKVVDSALTHARFSPEGDGGSGSPFTLTPIRQMRTISRESFAASSHRPTERPTGCCCCYLLSPSVRARSLSLLLAATYKVS